jgi:hypothetical protein
MNLSQIIPRNDKWIIKGNIVYIKHIANIPIVVVDEDDTWVYFDYKICKHVIQIVKLLQENKIEFLFKNSKIFFDHKLSEEDFHYQNLFQYLNNITKPEFFYGFSKIGFDFTQNLASYLKKYKCYDAFQTVYENRSKKILSKYWDWNSSNEIYRTPREDIRDYISKLKREIKINLII